MNDFCVFTAARESSSDKEMAKNAPLVLLGYDDELITDKQKSFIDCTVNKIGGKAVSIHSTPMCNSVLV